MHFTSLLSALVIGGIFPFLPLVASQQACYARALNHIYYESDNWFACGGTALTSSGAEVCCLAGSQCGSDSICHASPGQVLGSTSNNLWFVAGCTDSTYQDPVCRLSCTQYRSAFIQWNATEQLWQCCGDDGCDGSPTSDTFSAVAPSEWVSIPTDSAFTTVSEATTPVVYATTQIVSTITEFTQSETFSPVATTSATLDQNNSHSSRHLSQGVEAGIGVAVGFACLALAVAVLCIILHRRHKIRNEHAQSVAEKQMPSVDTTAALASAASSTSTGENDGISRSELESPVIAAARWNPAHGASFTRVHEMEGDATYGVRE